MCPGVDSATKNEYLDIPGGEGGLHSVECREDPAALPSRNPTKPLKLVTGNLYLYLSCGIVPVVSLSVLHVVRVLMAVDRFAVFRSLLAYIFIPCSSNVCTVTAYEMSRVYMWQWTGLPLWIKVRQVSAWWPGNGLREWHFTFNSNSHFLFATEARSAPGAKQHPSTCITGSFPSPNPEVKDNYGHTIFRTAKTKGSCYHRLRMRIATLPLPQYTFYAPEPSYTVQQQYPTTASVNYFENNLRVPMDAMSYQHLLRDNRVALTYWNNTKFSCSRK
jgi:hypothetical protein